MSSPLHFYRFCPYNYETKQQLWLSQLTDSHDIFCGCTEPIAHLLSLLFEPNHKDYNKTIKEVVETRFKQLQCHFGGAEEKSGGGEVKEDPSTKEEEKEKPTKEDFTEIDIEDLLAAVDAGEGPR